MIAPQNIILSSVWVEGLSTFIVGISVVFLALLILVVILTITGKFFENIEASKVVEVKSIPKAKPKLIENIEQSESEDDLELIAVITASIAASMGTDSNNFQVRSIRKTNDVWNMAGRKDQLYN